MLLWERICVPINLHTDLTHRYGRQYNIPGGCHDARLSLSVGSVRKSNGELLWMMFNSEHPKHHKKADVVMRKPDEIVGHLAH